MQVICNPHTHEINAIVYATKYTARRNGMKTLLSCGRLCRMRNQHWKILYAGKSCLVTNESIVCIRYTKAWRAYTIGTGDGSYMLHCAAWITGSPVTIRIRLLTQFSVQLRFISFGIKVLITLSGGMRNQVIWSASTGRQHGNESETLFNCFHVSLNENLTKLMMKSRWEAYAQSLSEIIGYCLSRQHWRHSSLTCISWKLNMI